MDTQHYRYTILSCPVLYEIYYKIIYKWN